jgi:hypothetical protein
MMKKCSERRKTIEGRKLLIIIRGFKESIQGRKLYGKYGI